MKFTITDFCKDTTYYNVAFVYNQLYTIPQD